MEPNQNTGIPLNESQPHETLRPPIRMLNAQSFREIDGGVTRHPKETALAGVSRACKRARHRSACPATDKCVSAKRYNGNIATSAGGKHPRTVSGQPGARRRRRGGGERVCEINTRRASRNGNVQSNPSRRTHGNCPRSVRGRCSALFLRMSPGHCDSVRRSSNGLTEGDAFRMQMGNVFPNKLTSL